ncbi:microfibril-associated glycoprotein 4-like isoform X2 [Zophobas morio]|uniref:microfibril-associated glycoprotein 4-like isoform X2 n=1 Tax=Zophobas morio TaxID=2755281 RepID=UPI003082EFB1
MPSRTFVLLLTLLVLNNAIAGNSDNPGFWVVSTSPPPPNQQNVNNVCVTGLKDKLKLHDAQIMELKAQIQATKAELLALTERHPEQKIFSPQDCQEVLRRGHKASGMYKIKPKYSPEEFWAWCDLTTRGGGWTYVVNRFDGSVDFFRNWTDYKIGFGDPSGEFWLGLEHLYHLTDSKRNELLFELEDWGLKKVYARYDEFIIGNEGEGYQIKAVGKFEGDAGDSFSQHVNMKFSTPDRDQDTKDDENCAATRHGSWWFLNCFYGYLTGEYIGPGLTKNHRNIHWNSFHGYEYSLKQVRMMIRPVD